MYSSDSVVKYYSFGLLANQPTGLFSHIKSAPATNHRQYNMWVIVNYMINILMDGQIFNISYLDGINNSSIFLKKVTLLSNELFII